MSARGDLVTLIRGRTATSAADEILASDWLARHDAEVAGKALRDAADEHEAELVCCDVYDRLSVKPRATWTRAERAEREDHDICYWGRACAVGDRARATEIEGQR